MGRSFWLACAAALASVSAAAAAPVLAPPAAPGPAVQPYVALPAGRRVLRHVGVIAGTGAPAQADRSVVIEGGKIVAVGGPDLPAPAGATELPLPGRTVIPGLVGLHDHMYYIARPNLDAAGHSE